MLKKQTSRPLPDVTRMRIAIVASRYNQKYVNGMLTAAQQELKRAGIQKDQIQVIRVPGTFEIPVVVARLAVDHTVDAILCLGAILRGETTHAHYIGEAVSHALMGIQVREGVPVIHEVLLFENESQARVRCLGREHNRGAEAARTAIEMASVMKSLETQRRE